MAEKAGLSRNTVTGMGKEEHVSLEVIVRICYTLKCEIHDLIGLKTKNEDPVKE